MYMLYMHVQKHKCLKKNSSSLLFIIMYNLCIPIIWYYSREKEIIIGIHDEISNDWSASHYCNDRSFNESYNVANDPNDFNISAFSKKMIFFKCSKQYFHGCGIWNRAITCTFTQYHFTTQRMLRDHCRTILCVKINIISRDKIYIYNFRKSCTHMYINSFFH